MSTKLLGYDFGERGTVIAGTVFRDNDRAIAEVAGHRAIAGRAPIAMQGEQPAMPEAPDDEGPVSAVPQTTQ